MKPLICLAILICGVALASAQERVIDQAAFEAVERAGGTQREKWAGKMFRMTVSTSARIIEKPESDYSAKMIFEYGLNGDFRNIHSSTFGRKTTTVESLSIGNWIYSRKATEPWTRKERQTGSGNRQSGDSGSQTGYEVISSVTEYKHLGVSDLKGEAVQIYLRTERAKKVNKSNGDTSDSMITRKYWINADGIILKDELVSDARWKDRSSHNTIVTEWELDSTMVFREPQISP